MRPILYVILDGLGDRPIPALGDLTPLGAAEIPELTSLARRGRTGLVQTVGKGIAPESDVAVTAILGYDPFTYHTGRGVFEAVGGRGAGGFGAGGGPPAGPERRSRAGRGPRQGVRGAVPRPAGPAPRERPRGGHRPPPRQSDPGSGRRGPPSLDAPDRQALRG